MLMLLQVMDIEDDEIQVNASRCLSQIITEADIKPVNNPRHIATVDIDFIGKTIDDPFEKERLHSLLNSWKSRSTVRFLVPANGDGCERLLDFVQHDQVKTELIGLQALPLLVRCVVETQFGPIKVQQTLLDILLALSFHTTACAYLRYNHSFSNHVRTLILTNDPNTSGLQHAAQRRSWRSRPFRTCTKTRLESVTRTRINRFAFRLTDS